MVERLVVIEGPAKSGKAALLTRLRNDGFIGLRGMPSRHPRENRFLARAAQELLEGVPLNFREVMGKSEEERNSIVDYFTQVIIIQQKRALKYMQDGRTVFLNRSGISLAALIDLEYSIALGMENTQLAEWAKMAGLRVREAVFGKPLSGDKTFLDIVNGLVLLKKPIPGEITSRQEAEEPELQESHCISSLAAEIVREKRIPLLELDANQFRSDEELVTIESFLNKI